MEWTAELARCDREIAEIQRDAELVDMPAWLVTMGLEDWEREKRLIEEERDARSPAGDQRQEETPLSARPRVGSKAWDREMEILGQLEARAAAAGMLLCPHCDGKGCQQCGRSGLVRRASSDRLSADSGRSGEDCAETRQEASQESR